MTTSAPLRTLFAKHYQSLGVERVCALAQEAGFEGLDAIVREGCWCQPVDALTTLPRFIAAVRAAGLTVPLAIVPQTAAQLAADPATLDLLAGEGIRDFRFGYFRQGLDQPRARIVEARSALAALVEQSARRGLRGILQLHHGTLHPSPSAAWLLIEGLPPKHLGVQLDPGNQSHEGFEQWPRSVRLLGAHLASVGVKDSQPVRDADARWTRPWVALDEGATDWPLLTQELAAAHFAGTLDFQPHYFPDDSSRSWELLRRDVKHFNSCWRAATAG